MFTFKNWQHTCSIALSFKTFNSSHSWGRFQFDEYRNSTTFCRNKELPWKSLYFPFEVSSREVARFSKSLQIRSWPQITLPVKSESSVCISVFTQTKNHICTARIPTLVLRLLDHSYTPALPCRNQTLLRSALSSSKGSDIHICRLYWIYRLPA